MYERQPPLKPRAIVRNTTADWFDTLREENACPIQELDVIVDQEHLPKVIALLASFGIPWKRLRKSKQRKGNAENGSPATILALTFPPETKKIPGLSTRYTYPYVVRLIDSQQLYCMDTYAIATMEKSTILCLVQGEGEGN